ncbi:MAG TPA: hypothetical protein PLA50_02570 [Bacteroidia bacterium]|nr:hypothetical protein [Bacteroidia bacterium]
MGAPRNYQDILARIEAFTRQAKAAKNAGQQEPLDPMIGADEQCDRAPQPTAALKQSDREKPTEIKDYEQRIKAAATVHHRNTSQYENPLLKMAYLTGTSDAAAMLDAQEAAPEGEEAGLPGAALGEPTIEEIVQLLDSMVASGEIDEETAAQAVEHLAATLGDEEEKGGMVVEASDAEALCDKLIGRNPG